MTMLPDFQQVGGQTSEVAALRNALAYLGIPAPHTGEPFSEAMLYGINGGIGASYFNFIYEDFGPTLYIGVSARYRTKSTDLLKTALRRLGLDIQDRTTGSEKVAIRHLREAAEAGLPALVFLSMGHLPWYGLGEIGRGIEHAVLVYGLDEDKQLVHISDLPRVPLQLPLNQLAEARAFVSRIKNRSVVVQRMSAAPELEPVRAAVRESIAECAWLLLDPPAPRSNFGLNALAKWADLVADFRDRRGWPNVFAPGPALYAAQKAVFHYVELLGTGGGASRGVYADFLLEAAGLLNLPELQDAAARYRHSARRWRALAEAALPDGIPAFKEVKDLARRKWELALAQGPAAAESIVAIRAREAEFDRELSSAYPLETPTSDEFYSALRERIQAILEIETEAARELKALFDN